jgi:hypothetical protein
MEWSNHAIALRASAEVVTRSLDNPRKAEDAPNLGVGESCDVGVIEVTWDLEGPEMVSAVCEEYPLVPRFEGEENDSCETMDLPVAEYSTTQIESPVVEIFDRAPKSIFGRVAEVPTSFLDPAVGYTRFLEGLESRYNASTTHIPQFEPFSVVGTYEEGQGGVEGLDEGGRLTIVDTGHLERPPGNVFVSIEPPTVKFFDPRDFAPKLSHKKVEELPPSVANLSAGCVKVFEGTETRHDEWVLLLLWLSSRFEPLLPIGTYGKGQVDAKSLFRGCGLTLDDIAHLLRPPGYVIEERLLVSNSLIAIVDACHMVLAHQVIPVFSSSRRWTLCRFEGECWNK